MNGRWTACVLACALALTGCGGGADAADEARPLEAVGESAGGLLVASVWLRDLASGEPDGWITFSESVSPGTVVQVRVQDQPPGARLAATVSRGTCGGGVEETQPIGQPFEVGSAGAGRHETRISVALDALVDGDHSVRLVQADDPTATLACGDIPERAVVAPERVL